MSNMFATLFLFMLPCSSIQDSGWLLSLPFNISEPKHVIKNFRFLSISQIKLFENESNIVVTTDFSTRTFAWNVEFCLYCFR